MAQEQGSTKFKHRALRMSNICRCQEPRTNQEGKTTSRIIEEVTYCSLARRPENARTWDKAHRNRKVAEVRDLSFCAGGRLTLARAHKDANSKDCADCADSVCENTDSVCECRSKRPAPTMVSPAAGSVWPPGIRMPTVKIALILCVNAGASARHPRWAARRQEASGRQEFGCPT